jgi:KDO2-lipid IV(A) lauroyltransferase
MSRPGRRLKRALESIGFRLFASLVRAMPHEGAVRLGAALGRLAFALGVRRRVSVQNVAERIAPPGGRAAAERIARESYGVMGRTFAFLLRMDLVTDERLWGLVSREDLEAVRVASQGRGAFLVSGHFGNWELLLLAVRRIGLPVTALAGEQSNSSVDLAIRDIRARAGIRPLSARSGLKEALAALRGGSCLVTLMDQDARSKGVFVPFLGTPASAHVGVVSIAMRCNVPLVPLALADEDGTYRFAAGTPWRADPSASKEENERAGTEHFHRFLEEQVRLRPGSYFWAHRRWKTRPPAGPGG